MGNLLFSISCVAPIFMVMSVGYFVRQCNIVDEQGFKAINKLAFNIAMPTMLFRDIAFSDIRTAFDLRFVVFCVTATIILFSFYWMLAEKIVEPKHYIGAFVQGCFRSNYMVIGLSLVQSIAGSEHLQKAALITAIIMPLYNVLAIIVLSLRSENTKKINIRSLLLSIIKNPLVIGILAALPITILHIRVPAVLETSIQSVASMGSPLAMIAVGGALQLKSVAPRLKYTLVVSFFRLIFSPIVSVLIAYNIVGIRGTELLIIMVLFASPASTSSYLMAANMKSGAELAADIVVVTTLCSVFTLTLAIFIFRMLQLI